VGVDRQEWVGQASSVSKNVVGGHEEMIDWTCTPLTKHAVFIEYTADASILYMLLAFLLPFILSCSATCVSIRFPCSLPLNSQYDTGNGFGICGW